jgi:CDGSH-type Zn-finger protein
VSEVASKAENVVIKVRENGPLLVTGPATVIDHLGNQFDTAAGANIALCRCGASLKKPFCDGTHKTSGFVGNETATAPTP